MHTTVVWCLLVAQSVAMPRGLECYIPGTAWDQGPGIVVLLNFLVMVPVTLDKLSGTLAPWVTIVSGTCGTRLDAIVNQSNIHKV